MTRASGKFSIGDVLGQLQPEFPNLTISKIRFLEERGLIQPERTASKYRMYSHADIARLRYVLTEQRDNYKPLNVIRSQLEAVNGSAVPHPYLAPVPPEEIAAEAAVPAARRGLLPREEFLSVTGLRADQLRDIEQFGLVTARAGGVYDDDAVAIGKAVAELSRFGIEGRHLRAFRAAADREIGLFSQAVSAIARHRSPEAKSRAEETVRELTSLSLRLHAALIRVGLRGVVGGS